MSDPTPVSPNTREPGPSQTQSSGTPPSTPSGQSPSSEEQPPASLPVAADSASPLDSVQVQSQCNRVVEAYRSGQESEASSILKIQQIIADAGPSVSGGAAFKALESYVRILDNFDSFRQSAAERGAQLAGGQEQERDQHAEGEPREEEVGAAQKRGREVADEDDEEESGQRRKVDVRQFPWVTREETSPTILSPELRKTIAALENFSRDIKLAKASLLNSPRCPQFPDSEWSNLLMGRVVDFDHVFSGVYSVSADSRSRERFGSLEVITGTSTPARTVKSHSDFVIAWERYNEACLFVFPHRQSELEAYGRFVKQLFTSIPAEQHSRVIHFDKAVRLRVSQRRDILLTDFQDLEEVPSQGCQALVVGQDEGRPVVGGTLASVPTPTPLATTHTSAPSAEPQDTLGMPAPVLTKERRESDAPSRFTISHYRPRYARDFIWAEDDEERVTLAVATEFFKPLPPVPQACQSIRLIRDGFGRASDESDERYQHVSFYSRQRFGDWRIVRNS
ncbi:hypothetical protein CVT26_014638 [Gymnopilus dilepis]|uniref:Uncharacterized protein n=1 Tax=Gymnopilus dilepis TaxID=231916 RepID=A0A409X8P3_9AGAR|nr:hypothetical protein CVT26_014638 [Gymnopilus dilepis]